MKNFYDQIVNHAANVEKSRHLRTTQYEEYKLGRRRLVRMKIKRGEIICEFMVTNDALDYAKDIDVKQVVTTMKIEGQESVDAAKSTIDLVEQQFIEAKKEARRKRREKYKAQAAFATSATPTKQRLSSAARLRQTSRSAPPPRTATSRSRERRST